MSSFSDQSLEEIEDKLKNGYIIKNNDILDLLLTFKSCPQRVEKLVLISKYEYDFDVPIEVDGNMLKPTQIICHIIENSGYMKFMSHLGRVCSCLSCFLIKDSLKILTLIGNIPKKRITLFMLMLQQIDQ